MTEAHVDASRVAHLPGLSGIGPVVQHGSRPEPATPRGIAGCTIGLLVLSGGDKWLEMLVLNHMPDWLLDLTTRY